MSRRYRFLYMNENWELSQGDSPRPKGKEYNDGTARIIVDMRHGKVWTGSEWEKIEVNNESESSD